MTIKTEEWQQYIWTLEAEADQDLLDDLSRQLLKSAQIPARYHPCRIDNFDPRRNPANIERLQNIFTHCNELSLNKWSVTKGLAFSGLVGSGKTHLSVGILKHCTELFIPCRFLPWDDLLLLSANQFRDNTLWARYDRVLNAHYLVIDDIANGDKTTPTEAKHLLNFVNYRYSNNLPTTVTFNHQGSGIEDRIGARTMRRIEEMTISVELAGGDIRLTI